MPAPQLQRRLGLWACLSLVAGSVIGSSIFMKPATMAAQLGSPVLLLAVWVVAGMVSIFGAMINAEIGAMLPDTGGQYVYFRHMYGRFFAYLYGWAGFIVINTAAIAAIAFIAAQYTTYFIPLPHFDHNIEQSFVVMIPFVGRLFPLENFGVKSLAICFVILFTLINHRSVKAGGNAQVLFTILKVGALLFLIVEIFFSGRGSIENFTAASSTMDFSTWPVVTGFVAATSGALAAYDGWNNIGFIGGEIKDPQKNIPAGLIGGLFICMFLYMATTLAYLYVLPVDEMKASALVATGALSKVMGSGAAIIALLVILSALGAVNGNILPCARITYAMAKDGLFFSWGATVDARYHTPSVALWLQCMVSCFFIISGSFDMLADLFVFVSWLFYGFAAFGIFILRKKMPHAERPYKLKGYPLIPVVFILFAAFYFFMTLYNDIHNYLSGRSQVINAALGLLLLMAGVPFYGWFRKKSRNRS